MALIELKDVVGGYGGAPILNGVNIAIEQSDIGVIVGPNGAGKSTTLKAIFGLLKVTGGTDRFRRRGHHQFAARQAGAQGAELRAAGKERLHLDDASRKTSRWAPSPAATISRRRSTGSTTCSRCSGEAPAAGGRTLGRAAPDGGHGPRADEQAEAADARRAVGGPVAALRASRSSSRSSRSTRRASAS